MPTSIFLVSENWWDQCCYPTGIRIYRRRGIVNNVVTGTLLHWCCYFRKAFLRWHHSIPWNTSSYLKGVHYQARSPFSVPLHDKNAFREIWGISWLIDLPWLPPMRPSDDIILSARSEEILNIQNIIRGCFCSVRFWVLSIPWDNSGKKVTEAGEKSQGKCFYQSCS